MGMGSPSFAKGREEAVLDGSGPWGQWGLYFVVEIVEMPKSKRAKRQARAFWNVGGCGLGCRVSLLGAFCVDA